MIHRLNTPPLNKSFVSLPNLPLLVFVSLDFHQSIKNRWSVSVGPSLFSVTGV